MAVVARFVVLIGAVLLVGGCTGSSESTESSTSAPILTTTTTVATTSTEGSTSTTTPPTTTSSTTTTVPLVPLEDLRLSLEPVADGFSAPIFLAADPDGGEDVVVEQPGRIVRIGSRDVLLDIRSDVVYRGERGLLGLAYHPEFASNRFAYVNYIDNNGDTVIAQFTVGSDGVFDTASRLIVLTIRQPAGNHNGGMIAFGPDGYLWIGMGDGGGSGDRYRNGQNTSTLHGSMLRIAVGVDGVDRYAIPPDNPFADGEAGAPEAYLIGLRNPWRFAFDVVPETAQVYIADVGQNAIEEVSVVSVTDTGANLGWPVMEGNTCYRSSSCDTEPFVPAAIDYTHAEGCSITGGYVYRGSAIPELDGHYFFSDFCTGFLRSFVLDDGVYEWTEIVGRTPAVSSFGIGGDGELYVVSHTGAILRLERQA